MANQQQLDLLVNLVNVNLNETGLRSANLKDADLSGADLNGTLITTDQLRQARPL